MHGQPSGSGNTTSSLTVACVLRSGGAYDATWVRRLAAGVAAHLPLPYRFVCLTDVPVCGVECLALEPGAAPGWWAKNELFRPGLLHGRCLYLDLDTVVVGQLEALAGYAGAFAGLSDFYRHELLQTGVLAWDADGEWAPVAWLAWALDPARTMAEWYGQGQWLNHVLGTHAERLQGLYPGQVVSYKVHCGNGVPAGARLVCMHGRPRLPDLRPGDPVRAKWERGR